MARNWGQVGEDFRQKYQGTYCRYKSPVTKLVEVFYISQVTAYPDKAPDLVLVNNRAGELYLTYETEAELDFTFPQCRLFNHDGRAYLFQRDYQRQYKKGVCGQTAKVIFPYDILAGQADINHINDDTIGAAFQPLYYLHPTDAARQIKDGKVFSVALSEMFSAGPGKSKDECWLWFQDEPIGAIKGDVISLKVKQFEQEIKDMLRNMGDYERTTVQAS